MDSTERKFFSWSGKVHTDFIRIGVCENCGKILHVGFLYLWFSLWKYAQKCHDQHGYTCLQAAVSLLSRLPRETWPKGHPSHLKRKTGRKTMEKLKSYFDQFSFRKNILSILLNFNSLSLRFMTNYNWTIVSSMF